MSGFGPKGLRPEQTTGDIREARELSPERLCRIQVGALRS